MVEAAKPTTGGAAKEEEKAGGENQAIQAMNELLVKENYEKALRTCNASK